MLKTTLGLLFLSLAALPVLEAISANVFMKLVAGGSGTGSSGNGGQATSAGIAAQHGWVNSNGVIFFADSTNHRVRKIDQSTGIISIVAGTGGSSTAGVTGSTSTVIFKDPWGIAGDTSGNLYISDSFYIWKYDLANNIVAVIAGTATQGHSGNGGPAIAAQVQTPNGLWLTTAGVLYFADTDNQVVRSISAAGIINAVAGVLGGTSPLGNGGQATLADLDTPRGVFMNTNGYLFISTDNGLRIRMVNPSGIISTYAGNGVCCGFNGDNIQATNAQLNYARHVVGDSIGNIFIADRDNYRIRMVDTSGIITTLFGSGSPGFTSGTASRTSAINNPQGVFVDNSGNVYFSDQNSIHVSADLTPTVVPTAAPTRLPTAAPSTTVPTAIPTFTLTASPTATPTVSPTCVPTITHPSSMPSSAPSYKAEAWGQVTWEKRRHRQGGFCENHCSNHGTCETNLNCKCFTGLDGEPEWTGPDCSLRTCPKDISWIGDVVTANNLHPVEECSNKGICDRSSGVCNCFPGYEGIACQRTVCPNNCNDRGSCWPEKLLAGKADRVYQLPWDAMKHVGCFCDKGYRGPACEFQECPSGSDPLNGYGNEAGRDCSGRGICDYTSGTCSCFQSFYGTRCQYQTTVA
jgi:sugar lactone lactonase YvrE